MNKSRHTPGPWKAIHRTGNCSDGWPVAMFANWRVMSPPMHGDSLGSEEADVHLIAAAPELLAFLKKWARFNIEGSAEEQTEYDTELLALIAKAEGK